MKNKSTLPFQWQIQQQHIKSYLAYDGDTSLLTAPRRSGKSTILVLTAIEEMIRSPKKNKNYVFFVSHNANISHIRELLAFYLVRMNILYNPKVADLHVPDYGSTFYFVVCQRAVEMHFRGRTFAAAYADDVDHMHDSGIDRRKFAEIASYLRPVLDGKLYMSSTRWLSSDEISAMQYLLIDGYAVERGNIMRRAQAV